MSIEKCIKKALNIIIIYFKRLKIGYLASAYPNINI